LNAELSVMSSMSGADSFDVVLTRGHVICPASDIEGIIDVGVKNGRIAAIEPHILPSAAKQTIDVGGKLVLPGLIDTHGHVYQITRTLEREFSRVPISVPGAWRHTRCISGRPRAVFQRLFDPGDHHRLIVCAL
jgi:predicted amidohydrolase YtcJ